MLIIDGMMEEGGISNRPVNFWYEAANKLKPRCWSNLKENYTPCETRKIYTSLTDFRSEKFWIPSQLIWLPWRLYLTLETKMKYIDHSRGLNSAQMHGANM